MKCWWEGSNLDDFVVRVAEFEIPGFELCLTGLSVKAFTSIWANYKTLKNNWSLRPYFERLCFDLSHWGRCIRALMNNDDSTGRRPATVMLKWVSDIVRHKEVNLIACLRNNMQRRLCTCWSATAWALNGKSWWAHCFTSLPCWNGDTIIAMWWWDNK